jgi:ATP-dependent helicase/nuclease subunit A
MPVDKFIWYLYMQTGYYSYAGAMTGGLQHQANLKILFERARQYEQTSYRGLFNFINFIHRLQKSSGDMGSAKILGENENVVRIMSIHKSKGLEFPVVFVSGAGKNFNMMDLRRSILFHQELGLGPDYVDYKRRISYSSIMKEALKTKIRLETLSEEMRILYVAFTRAKEKLIITGTVKDIEKSACKWGASTNHRDGKVPQFEVSSASSYLDWICASVMVHPDCRNLRDMAGVNNEALYKMAEDMSSWDVRLLTYEDVLTGRNSEVNTPEDVDAKLKAIDPALPQSKYTDEINRRLKFEYPYIGASRISSAVSVSELKRLKNEELEDENTVKLMDEAKLKKPGFIQEVVGLSASEKGTVMHLVMQHLDFKKSCSYREIKEQINEMITNELLSKIQADSVYIKRIEDFFKSSLGDRILSSNSIRHEVPFIIKILAIDIYKDLPWDKYEDEYIILRGIIDCYFEEDDGIVLIDYKTDYVTEDNKEQVIERYKSQLDL